MLEHKTFRPIAALLGATALMMSGPTLVQAQPAKAPATAAAPAKGAPAASAPASAPAAAPAPAPAETDEEANQEQVGGKQAGSLTIASMVGGATWVVKGVLALLAAGSFLSWTILFVKLFEFGGLNRTSDRFLEAFRSARSVADIRRISTSDEFEGNPLADMAAAASEEVELSRQAGLQVAGEHRDSTLSRASAAVSAVQATLARRLAGGQVFLASLGSSGPFIGLFGTVYGIMHSFIGIANSHTTNLAVVAPGIAEALLATGVGLFAAIPAVIMYNIFQTRISAYGARSEGFVAELLNAISRQLDKGA